LAGIALAARPAAQLIVDAARFEPTHAQDMQPAQGDDPLPPVLAATAQANVGSATGHIRGNGNRIEGARFRHYGSLVAIVAGVEHLHHNPRLDEPGR